MSPLTRSLLALACASLLHAASAARFHAPKTGRHHIKNAARPRLTRLQAAASADVLCDQLWMGDLDDMPDHPVDTPQTTRRFTYNVTGKFVTSIEIPNKCPDIEEDYPTKLVRESIKVCSHEDKELDIVAPKPHVFSPVKVACFTEFLGRHDIPCLISDPLIEVEVLQYCQQYYPYEDDDVDYLIDENHDYDNTDWNQRYHNTDRNRHYHNTDRNKKDRSRFVDSYEDLPILPYYKG